MDNFITVKNETRQYGSGEQTVYANHEVSFTIKPGEITVILGASGAGKSTLLNILGGMDRPTSGQVVINGHNIAQYDDHQLTTYRRDQIGFVFQFYNLVPNLTALENVELASEIAPDALDPKQTMVDVGLGKRINNLPAQLSGGEQQRVAIAHAIAKNPSLLLADEPTGALDYKTGKSILKLFEDFSHQTNKNVMIVTHNSLIKPMADHVIEIHDGKVQADYQNEQPTPVEQLKW